MRKAHQVSVGAGRIDYNHVMAVLNRADRRRKFGELLRFVRFQRIAFGTRNAVVRGHLKRNPRAFSPGAAVVDVVGKALLTGIKVNGRNALPGFQQRDRNVQGSC
jgi:hypothetical protein